MPSVQVFGAWDDDEATLMALCSQLSQGGHSTSAHPWGDGSNSYYVSVHGFLDRDRARGFLLNAGIRLVETADALIQVAS